VSIPESGPGGNVKIRLNPVKKIPLNPPLQKGEEVGRPELIERLRKKHTKY